MLIAKNNVYTDIYEIGGYESVKAEIRISQWLKWSKFSVSDPF